MYPRCSFMMSDRQYVNAFIDRYKGKQTKIIIEIVKKFERTYIYANMEIAVW